MPRAPQMAFGRPAPEPPAPDGSIVRPAPPHAAPATSAAAQFEAPAPAAGAGLDAAAQAAPTRQPNAAAPAPARAAASAPSSPFLPLLLGLLALAVWLGHQVWLLAADRAALQAAHAAQQPTMDNAGRLRASLDALAADTQRLADAGSPNAKLLVDELRKRGVTINPQAPAGR